MDFNEWPRGSRGFKIQFVQMDDLFLGVLLPQLHRLGERTIESDEDNNEWVDEDA